MKNSFLPFCLAVLALSCSEPGSFHELKADNPEFIPDTAFASFEDLKSPKFAALKAKYQLDTIFHGETDELKRILLLRNWIRSRINIDNVGPYPGDGSPESILDEAAKGHGFHCGHYMIVQNAVMNAYGYVTRCLGAGEGTPDFLEGHHGINEIWLNTYHKWFMSDAKYNYHFEKDGIPLSALEIRDAYLKNKAADIMLVKGPGRVPTEIYPELNNRPKELFARIYTWISWEKYNNRYTIGPNDSSDIVIYRDNYSENHTWIRDGKPHWAYNTHYLHWVPDRKAVEWTPNIISSKVTIDGDKSRIELNSNSPNLKTYQMKELLSIDPAAAAWKDVSKNLEIELKKDTNELLFRTINIAGVAGPEHKIIIAR
jgi:hypothetical protein